MRNDNTLPLEDVIETIKEKIKNSERNIAYSEESIERETVRIYNSRKDIIELKAHVEELLKIQARMREKGEYA